MTPRERRLSESRRSFIQKMGLTAGAALPTPMVDGLVSQAQGQEVRHKRFINYWSSNGIAPGHIAAEVRNHRDFDLPMTLSGLDPVKEHINVFRHLRNSAHSFLHRTSWSASTSARVRGGDHGSPSRASFDYVLSRELGMDTPRPLVVIGADTYSAEGAGQPFTPLNGPTRAWDALFQNPTMGGDAADRERELARRQALRLNVLDFIADDIRRARQELAGEERIKLDQTLTAVEGLSNQERMRETTVTCQTPDRPGEGDAADWVRGNVQVGLAAVACGITRHLTVGFPNDGANRFLKFRSLGINHGLHSLYHGAAGGGNCGGICNQAQAMPLLRRLIQFHSEQVAFCYQFLSQIPEGDGTMADNTLICWTSDGENHHGPGNRMCAITVWDAGGGLRSTGNYITYEAGSRFLPEMWLTMAQAMGSSMETFGDGSDPCREPLPGMVG